MENYVDVKLKKLGILNGRDCIYIDKVTFDSWDSLTFKGQINGSLASEIRKELWIPYKLTFKRVLAYYACELDTFLNSEYGGYMTFDYGDFTVVENSEKLKNLPIREDFDRSIYKHYRVFTYDTVFDIIAVDFEFKSKLKKAKEL